MTFNLVSTDFKGEQFIDPLRNAALTLNMGVTTLVGLTGPVDIPRQTGSLSTFWIDEDENPTESDLTFDKVSILSVYLPRHAQMAEHGIAKLVSFETAKKNKELEQ